MDGLRITRKLFWYLEFYTITLWDIFQIKIGYATNATLKADVLVSNVCTRERQKQTQMTQHEWAIVRGHFLESYQPKK